MERYDYTQAMKEDILQYLKDTYTSEELKENLLDLESFYETLNDDLWTEDSVTGNGSGSYTFNTYKAEEYICHNLDLLAEACEEFGSNTDVLKSGAEACDVTIRCYLLGSILYGVLEELNNDLDSLED